MSEVIGGVIFILLIIALFTIPVGMFNVKMFKGSNSCSPSGGELVKAYIPFANIRFARVLAYGTSPIYLALLIMCGVILLVRGLSFLLVGLNIGVGVYIAFFSSFASLLAIAIWWVLAAVNGVDFANMLQAGTVTKICCIILPPMGYYMLSNVVLPYFRSEEAGTNDTFGASH